jgi:hypothetical protein
LVNPVIPAKDSPESDEDIGGDQKPIPEDPIDGDGQEMGLDCGTGAGGFQPGNSCGKGGGIQSSIRDATPSGYGPSTSSQEKTKEQRMRGESIDDAISRKVGYQVDNGRVKIAEDKGGWVVSVAQPEGKPKQYRSYNRQQAINQAYTELYPDTELIPHPSDIGEKPQKKSNLEILESLDPASIKMLIEGMMGGIELAKYDGIDFTPPQGARDAAKRALDVRETKPSSQRGMTPVGIARARDLQNGVKMSPDTIRRMKAFLDRHEVDKKGSTWDEQGKGWQAWHGWGGDAGYAWARKVVGQMEARDKKELARPVSQTPAPPKERIKGSKENPEGTASTRSKAGDIEISAENEEALKNKIAEFKDKHPSRKAPTLGALKKVFRRGAGAFSTSFRPTITGGKPNSRNAWAMARVNKFLKMAGGGEVKKSYRAADGDLL